MKPDFPTALHILKKDCRHLASRIAILYVMALLFWLSFSREAIAPEWSLILNFGYAIAMILVCYAAMRSDSVTSTTAWWQTRPIAPATLWLSKILLWAVAVALPLALAATAVALQYQLTGGQILLTVMEMILITGAGFALVGACVSMSATPINGGLMITTVMLLLFVSSLISVGRSGIHHAHTVTIQALPERSLTMGLGVLVLAAFLAWGLRMFRRNGGIAILALVIGVGTFMASAISASWDRNLEFPLSPTDEQRIGIQLLKQPKPFPFSNHGSQIYQHFEVTGLNTNEFATLADILGTFQFADGTVGNIQERVATPGGSDFQFEQRVLPQLEPSLLRYFPSTTTWTSDWQTHRRRMFPVAVPSDAYHINQSSTGTLEGTLHANIMALNQVGQFPLRTGVYGMDPGRALDLSEIKPQWDSIEVTVSFTRPRLALSREPESNLTTPYVREKTRYVFVVYHNELAEGYLMQDSYPQGHTSFRTLIPLSKQPLRFKIPFSNLKSSLKGISMQDWIKGATIHAFKLTPVGTKAYAFNSTDYRPYSSSSRASEAIDAEVDALTLAENASPEEIEAYTRSVMKAIPDDYTRNAITTFREKILAIPSSHLPLVLDLLPSTESQVNTYVQPYVNKRIQPEHLPAFRKLWAKHDHFITYARRMKWTEQIRDVVRDRLQSRDPMSPHAVAIAAESCPTERYPDLAWHFVHSRWGHNVMLRAMTGCEGLDTAPLVTEAWRRARIGIGSSSSLPLPAAQLGLPDALAATVAQFEESQGDRQKELNQMLQELTGYTGTDEGFVAWLNTHLSRLQFDPSTHTYRLSDNEQQL